MFGFVFDMFNVVGVVFLIMFVIVVGIIIFALVKGIRTWKKNNHSPRLTVTASVVSKRVDISHQLHTNGGDHTGTHGYHTTSSTWYYVTFQFESGDRMEFPVNGLEYGMLAEGDNGKLTFQGTRYLGFERI